jgi:(5-formylfuran-3-yl)methyl phosphate synthase
VDIIDLKAPASGVLGALPAHQVREIVAEIAGRRPVSATTGDLPMEPLLHQDAAKIMAATGVDFVKIGFFPGGDWPGTLSALAELARQGTSLVAVLLADQPFTPDIVEQLARAGFAGAMLDTQDKNKGSLTTFQPVDALRRFVLEVRERGMFCGLAGSLRAEDIPALLSLSPDYLGFRGALCREHERTSSLDAEAIAHIRALIPETRLRSN